MSTPTAGLEVDLHVRHPTPLDLKFACAPGELVALIGPSGAGKTSTLRTIAGLHRARGRIACGGVAWLDTARGVDLPPHRRRVGLVFQAYALFPHLDVQANVEAAMSHLPRAARAARAQELLALVELDRLAGRRPDALSGGEQQRVALARALARDPAALLLDEPLSAVDRGTRRRLHAALAAARTRSRAPIVLVTHDLDEAQALADRLVVIDRGEVLHAGTPAEILAAPASPRVRAALDLDA